MQTIFEKIVPYLSNVLTIIVSIIALYVFFFKRKTITIALKALLRYSSQIRLHELMAKIERLNYLHVDDPGQASEAINILNEIVGQIRGNTKLKKHCSGILRRLSVYTKNPEKLTDPQRRNLISELKERLECLDVEDFENFIGGLS